MDNNETLKEKIYDFFWLQYQMLKDWKYEVKCFFFPYHNKLRKAIPRTWSDSDYVLRILNFALITEFVEDELQYYDENYNATKLNGKDKLAKIIQQYENDILDCINNKDKHNDGEKEMLESWLKFYIWISEAYEYITITRPKLEIELDNAYPPIKGGDVLNFINDGIPYEVKYGEVNRLEKLIEDNDTKVLKELTEHRNGFWT